MFKRTTPLILLVASLGMTISLPAMAEDNGNQRRGWFKEFDYNGDKELKGKEIKEFKKAHEPAYTRLQQWCEDAMAKPKKMGVDLPEDEKEAKKLKCKKGKVSREYMKAWVADAPPDLPTVEDKEAANEAATETETESATEE